MLIMKPAIDFVCLMVQAIQRLHDQYNVIEEVVSSLEASLSLRYALRCSLRNTCRLAGHQMFVLVHTIDAQMAFRASAGSAPEVFGSCRQPERR